MIELEHPITREVPSVQIMGRSLVVELVPPDKLHLRLKGMRSSYIVPLDACFWLGARAEAERLATMNGLEGRRRRRRRKGE